MSFYSTKSCRFILISVFSSLVSSGAYAANQVYMGNVRNFWKISELSGASPETSRFTNLTFRFNVDNSTLHHNGTYFAQQFYFDNSSSGGNLAYLGLQPRPSKNGKDYLRAVFSSFIAETKTTDSNCSEGADGGPGASCGVEFPATYGHTYAITVSKKGDHTWSGEVKDMVTHEVTHIGSWSLPNSIGNLRPSGSGFVEYYAFYKPGYPQFVVPDCSQLAKVNVLFGPVTTTDFGGGIGSVTSPSEYGSDQCKGAASGYSSYSKNMNITLPNCKKVNADGQVIIRGFVSNKDK